MIGDELGANITETSGKKDVFSVQTEISKRFELKHAFFEKMDDIDVIICPTLSVPGFVHNSSK